MYFSSAPSIIWILPCRLNQEFADFGPIHGRPRALHPVRVDRRSKCLLQHGNECFRTLTVEDCLDLAAPRSQEAVPILEQAPKSVNLSPDRFRSECSFGHPLFHQKTPIFGGPRSLAPSRCSLTTLLDG